MAPTFLGLAGLKKPAQMDGKSIAPFLMPAAYAEIATVADSADGITALVGDKESESFGLTESTVATPRTPPC
jgi:arylsulfatase A-like enzyme